MTSVCICIPSGDHVLAQCAYQVPMLMSMAHREGVKLGLLNARSYSPAENLRLMNGIAVEQGFDYVLNFDSDMIVPNDAVLRLLAHDKAFVGAVYRNRSGKHQVFGEALHSSGDHHVDGPAFEAPFEGLHRARWLPGGCVLIRRDVLEAVPQRFDRFEGGIRRWGHDVGYCFDAQDAGFEVWADLDLSRDILHCGITGLGLEGMVQ